MQIGIDPDVKGGPYWKQVRAYLQPAADLGGVAILEAGELCWLVFRWEAGGMCAPCKALIGAATTRLLADGDAEVILVGGRDYRAWIGPLDDFIGCWAVEEGATKLIATGRKGWRKVLTDWDVAGERDGIVRYERGL